MATKMFFGVENCQGATSEQSGKHYKADRDGFIHVESQADVNFLRKGGYSVAGAVRPQTGKYWECECGWQSPINSCPHCSREDLTKHEA
jgi:hypothetical protein